MNNRKDPTSGQWKMSARSQSAAAISGTVEAEENLLCNDNQPERCSLGSSLGPLSISDNGQRLCSERSHSLPSVVQLSEDCLNLRSLESNPVSRSEIDLDRNSRLPSSNKPTPADTKVGKDNSSQVDKA